jgi:hypothetical protein
MRFLVFTLVLIAVSTAATSADPVVGRWEGTSLCQVKPSACHDEHAVYYTKKTASRRYKLDAYKLVGGQEQFMGAINLTLDARLNELEGIIRDRSGSPNRLKLILRGDHLSGAMTLADGRVYRLIELRKR